MKITLEKEITLASSRKLIRSSTIIKVFVRFEGKAKFSVETEDTEKDKVELKLGKEAELKINDLFFGAHGAVNVSKDKIEFKLGIEDFEVTFNPSLTNPVSFHIPAIKVPVAGKDFKLEQEITSLGLKGKAEMEVDFVIEVFPNYRHLARTMKPTNIRAAAQIAKNNLYTLVRKTKAIGKIFIKGGRAAIFAPFKWLGNQVGKYFAKQAIYLGSQTAAAKIIGKTFLGFAGIVIETWIIAKGNISAAFGIRHKEVIDGINSRFIYGYVTILADYTDTNAPLTDKFFNLTAKIERIASEPPDMYGVIEILSKTGNATPPKKNVQNWMDDQFAKGIRYRTENVPLSEADWPALYRECYNICFLFTETARISGNAHHQRIARNAMARVYKLVEIAGMIAAHQDILGFVIATSLYEDLQGNQPTDVWEEWKNVSEFHRMVFGGHRNQRIVYYRTLIDVGSLSISIPPFEDYADWAN